MECTNVPEQKQDVAEREEDVYLNVTKMECTSSVPEQMPDVADGQDEGPTRQEATSKEPSYVGSNTSNFLPCSFMQLVIFCVLTIFVSYCAKLLWDRYCYGKFGGPQTTVENVPITIEHEYSAVVFTDDEDHPDKLKIYHLLSSLLREQYESKFSPACVYYESSLNYPIYLDKENSWKGGYTIIGTQESIELSVRQEGSLAVHLRIHSQMQKGIESSSEENNYELLLGDSQFLSNTFWKLTKVNHVDYDYLLCKFVEEDTVCSKTELMEKIRINMKA